MTRSEAHKLAQDALDKLHARGTQGRVYDMLAIFEALSLIAFDPPRPRTLLMPGHRHDGHTFHVLEEVAAETLRSAGYTVSKPEPVQAFQAGTYGLNAQNQTYSKP